MALKVFFCALVTLHIVSEVLTDPAFCPEPSDANLLVYKQSIRETAPEFGRTEKEYFIPKLDKTITCITLSGTATGSIASIGFSDKGIKVKLVSDIKEGFDATLDVYSK